PDGGAGGAALQRLAAAHRAAGGRGARRGLLRRRHRACLAPRLVECARPGALLGRGARLGGVPGLRGPVRPGLGPGTELTRTPEAAPPTAGAAFPPPGTGRAPARPVSRPGPAVFRPDGRTGAACAASMGAVPGPARRAPPGTDPAGRAGGGPGPPGSAAASAPLPVGAALACPQSARFETAGTVAGGGPRPVPPERGRDGAGRGPPPMPVPRPAVCAGPWRPPGDSVNRSPPERYVLPDRADGGRRRAMTTTGATGKPCERARDDPS